MQYKYCVNFIADNHNHSHYYKGNNPNQAILRCLKSHRTKNITSIIIIGDPIPASKDFAAQQIAKQLKSKELKNKRWIAALKYEKIAGISPYLTKKAKS